MKTRILRAGDLYCGAGGMSTGLLQACKDKDIELELFAINHWQIAIDTHSSNHPNATHLCTGMDEVDPLKVVPGGHLHLLMAAPECTHHSNARGGKPMSDQSRSNAWNIIRFAQTLEIDNILIENVREFTNWGPLYNSNSTDKRLHPPTPNLDGRPIPERKGEYYRLFLHNLRKLGYTVQGRVLNAAHYGDATTRQRLFIQARKGRKRISWPNPSHMPQAEISAYAGAKPWRAAREIIDWDVPGKSIYGRKKPLAPNTMARIMAGLQKYSGLPFVIGQQSGAVARSTDDPIPTIAGAGAISLVEPFLVVLRNNCDAQSLDDPCPTVTAGGGHLGLAQPFIMGTGGRQGQMEPRSLDEPLRTILTNPRLGVIEPFMIPVTHSGGENRAYDIDAPVPTITCAKRGEISLVEPFILPHQHGASGPENVRSIDEPLPTITGTSCDMFIAEPFIIGAGGPTGQGYPQGVDEPLGTVLGVNHRAVIEPYIVNYHGNHAGKTDGDNRTQPVDEPLRTLDTSNRFAVAQPFLIKYYGTSNEAYSIDDPLGTITSKDRFALVHPEMYDKGQGAVTGILDIRFRMLQPHELAGAMSFPKEYQFAGNRDDQVKQIGNAVPCRTAQALCKAMIGGL